MRSNRSTSMVRIDDRRRFFRVACERDGRLVTESDSRHPVKVLNLSMGGLLLHGQSELRPGDRCKLELHEEGPSFCRVISFWTQVVRTDDQSHGLEFLHMDDDGHTFLQTLLLYHADDPLRVVAEFQDNSPRSSMTASC